LTLPAGRDYRIKKINKIRGARVVVKIRERALLIK
jgi:hypothetical protein